MTRATATRDVDVLLVGGGVASARCARTLRRRGYRGSILLVGDEARAPYNRPPLSKELLAGEVPDDLIAAEPAGWYERRSVELALGVSVEAIDPEAREARLADGRRFRFGSMLLATGAEPRRPPVPGAEHAMLLRTESDARQIRSAATGAEPGAGAVVVGGGFIGVEVAGSLAATGLRVTLLELSDALWAGSLGRVLSAWAVRRLAEAGVAVRLETAASALEPGAVLVGRERLAAGLLVAGVGVKPRTELAESAGLTVQDGVVVDASRRAAPGIFAAGDVARVPHPLAGSAGIRVEHWHAALEGGEAAALGILGEPVPSPRAPWVYSEFAGHLVDVVGFAPVIDAEVVLGDPDAGRFSVAHLLDGRVAQLSVVNGHLPIDEGRRFVEASPSASELDKLVPP
jgi:NADPH-dependent 2,4-dienoyl-CoA reductase/sulfur reductase-like enzyme